MAKTITTKGVTTGRTPVIAIPVTTIDATILKAINVSNPDTLAHNVIIRINSSGTYKILTEIPLIAGVKATEEIVFPGNNPANTETVTINGKVYTFLDTLTGSDGQVKRGVDDTASRDNLVAAMDRSGTDDVEYDAAMTAHPDCDGVANGDDITVTAKEMGVYGNAFTLAEATATAITITTPLSGGLEKQDLAFNNSIGLALGDKLEILIARPVGTTELDWVCTYVENPS